MKLLSIFCFVVIDIIFTIGSPNNKNKDINLSGALAQIENVIKELAEWYDNLTNVKPSVRSRYYGFDHKDLENVNFLNMGTQSTYLQVLQKFVKLIHREVIPEPKLMIKLGHRFLVYNELLEAIENDANKILKSSSQSIFARQSISEKEPRQFLKMVLKLFAEEDFYSENLANRQGIQSAMSQISSEYK